MGAGVEVEGGEVGPTLPKLFDRIVKSKTLTLLSELKSAPILLEPKLEERYVKSKTLTVLLHGGVSPGNEHLVLVWAWIVNLDVDRRGKSKIKLIEISSKDNRIKSFV